MMAATEMGEDEAISQFRAAMAAAGLRTDDAIAPTLDDDVARFHVDGDPPRTKNGWYVLFMDGVPAGEFGCWKRGTRSTWTATTGGKPLSAEQRAEADAKLEAARKRREAAERARQGEAARRANEILATAPAADDAHRYLVRKGVRAHGLRVGRWVKTDDETGDVWLDVPDALLVPVMNQAGKVMNLQAIFPDKHPKLGRDKDFLRNGKKKGGFHLIGAPKPGAMVVICEGYATGASIHECTGWTVAVAFDAGNLVAVAEALADAMAGHTFLIAADNDQWTTQPKPNPGVYHATEAGKVINCRVVVPQFADLDGEPTDFNDLHQREGAAEVVRQLGAAIPVAANDPTPPTRTDLVELAGGEDMVEPRPEDVDVFSLPDVGGKGKVLSTIENLAEILKRLRVVVRYNVISKEEEYLIPGRGFSVDNQANASIAWIESWCARFRMSTEKLGSFLTFLADANQFNPVVAWVTSRPWDGVDRLPDMFATITPVEDVRLEDGRSLKDALIFRWMVSAIAAAFSPNGVEAQGALVLQGPQGLGKTKWMLNLVPRELGLAKEGVTLRLDDKDSIRQAVSHWLTELGELDGTFKKSDIAALKAFITKGKDTLRRAFAKKDSNYGRRTVFFGSVNPKHYLIDNTGNRRFWTIECAAIDFTHPHLDMQQVWAQVLELWKGGAQFHLDPLEHAAVNEQNEHFAQIDPVEERIQTRLDWGVTDAAQWGWRTATDCLIAIGMDKPTASDCTKAATAIRKLNGDQGKRSNGRNLLWVPPPVPYGARTGEGKNDE
jgi:putative DNA primase/helicase